MIYDFIKNIECTNSLVCSNLFLNKLERTLNLKLHAETETETGLEGSLSIHHVQKKHQIRVELYNVTKGRLKRPDIIPTHNLVFQALDSTIADNPSIITRVKNLFNL